MPGTKSDRTGEGAALASLPGWDRLRHGGLLLDGMRLATLARQAPAPLDAWTEPPWARIRISTASRETDDIREYVEYLAEDAGAPAPDADEVREMFGASPADIYRAACRVAMRLVVILFAESRDLLPRDNPLYHQSYGLHGLLERLERAAARGGSLAGSFGAWPRILALFALVREGSHHPDLPVTAYGGDLFAPGAADAEDGVSRALCVYEQACFRHEVMPDRDVHEMLKLLTRTTIRIRQGRSSIAAVVPVDFSDLSSEYIGILYEGLLDYELKIAPAGDPVIFLSVGDQPALPLSRLEAMDDGALRTLFERLKEKSGGTDDLPEEETAEDDASNVDENSREEEESLLSDAAEAAPSPDGAPERAAGAVDERQRSRTRAEEWARRAVQAARLLKKPRGRDTPERRLAFEQRLAAKARQLVARVVLPGEWYLVRWGGTRKGSGSFYTRPGLAVPTVQRTLRPLAYDPPAGADGQPDVDAPPARWTPKPPERILDLTVCDPACGSGTFPLAALRSSPMRSTPRSSTTAASNRTATGCWCVCSASGTRTTRRTRTRPPSGDRHAAPPAANPASLTSWSPAVRTTTASSHVSGRCCGATSSNAASTPSISTPWRWSCAACRCGSRPWIAPCRSASSTTRSSAATP